jgi:hypothetical protein
VLLRQEFELQTRIGGLFTLAAQDHVAFRRLHDYETPLTVERVRNLVLTPE